MTHDQQATSEIAAMMRKRDPGETRFGLKEIWVEQDKLATLSPYQKFKHLASQGWRSFRASPVTGILTLFTVSMSLFLLGAALLLYRNTSAFILGGKDSLTIRVYLDDRASDAVRLRLEQRLVAREGVKSVLYIDKQGALQEFAQALEDQASLVEGLVDDNPLPASFEVVLDPKAEAQEFAKQLAHDFEMEDGVKHVQYNKSLFGELSGLVSLVTKGGLGAVGIVLLITAFVIAITIRLGLFSHRYEIQIMKLVGATDGYIRVPYLIEGLAQGVLGSLLALTLLYSLHAITLNALNSSEFGHMVANHWHFLEGWGVLFILITGPVLGLFGSFMAVRRLSYDD